MRQPPHRFLNLVYGWVFEHMSKEKFEEFNADLDTPEPETKPTRIEDVPEAVREEEGAAFMAVMGLPG